MARIEHTRGNAVGEGLPEDHNDIGDAFSGCARCTRWTTSPTGAWDRPEDYPQSWDVRAHIDAGLAWVRMRGCIRTHARPNTGCS